MLRSGERRNPKARFTSICFHALNGPSGDEQVTGVFTAAQIQEKVAAAIAATGFAPLCRFGREGRINEEG